MKWAHVPCEERKRSKIKKSLILRCRRRSLAGDREMCDWNRLFVSAGNGRSPIVHVTRDQPKLLLLVAAPLPNAPGRRKQLLDIFRHDGKAAVVICENVITCLPFDPPVLAERGTVEALVFDENA